MQKASVKTTLPANTLPPNSNPANFSFSLWFYITSWSCNNAAKSIFSIKGTDPSNPRQFYIDLGACQNDLDVGIMCTSAGGQQKSVCHVKNVPLQRWVCLIVSVYGRTLDIYLDGKLVRTCVLPGTSSALGKIQMFTGAAAQSALTEFTAGAYPAGALADSILGRAVFIRI